MRVSSSMWQQWFLTQKRRVALSRDMETSCLEWRSSVSWSLVHEWCVRPPGSWKQGCSRVVDVLIRCSEEGAQQQSKVMTKRIRSWMTLDAELCHLRKDWSRAETQSLSPFGGSSGRTGGALGMSAASWLQTSCAEVKECTMGGVRLFGCFDFQPVASRASDTADSTYCCSLTQKADLTDFFMQM